MEIKYKREEFRHEYTGEVKFSEVDSFNVVHNLAYLYWLEWARTQYLFDIGMPRDDSIFSIRMPIMTVHSEVDYYNSMKFTDIYTVLTRVSKIGDSSITFVNQVYSANKLILEAKSILVYVDTKNGKPVTIPGFVREKINNYEK
ncbi:MAG: thioesterase family protein [Candidatus Kapaibacterium sp.]